LVEFHSFLAVAGEEEVGVEGHGERLRMYIVVLAQAG
jgi:hypothetical protein